MSILCSREAFKLDEGCPQVEVDLEFPDFDACEAADVSRLKGVSNVGARKSPAFPMFMPAAEQIPADVPDVSDLMCILGTVSGNPVGPLGGHSLHVSNPFNVNEDALTIIVPVAGIGTTAVVNAIQTS